MGIIRSQKTKPLISKSRRVPPQPTLIHLQRLIPTLLVIHAHPRIPSHHLNPQPLSPSPIRIMHRLPHNTLQLRYPLPNILPLRIKLLTLQNRIKNAEIRLRVHARTGAEAPPAVIAREVAVDEMFHEVALAQAPVEEEVFGEEGGDGHARPVVHVACGVELAHGGVDEGVAGGAGAPFLEECGVVVPVYVCVFGFEGFVHTVGEWLAGDPCTSSDDTGT